MATLTAADLRRVLVECSGDSETPGLDEGFLTASFEQLGFDSLALLETAARLKQEFLIDLPDDEVHRVETPEELLSLVQEQAKV
ncbi:acyl carrier protein [Streptomyces platensis]